MQVVLRKLGRGSRAVVGRLVRAPRKGSVVVIEFPDRESAHAWYASPEYQAILRLRTDNSDGDAFIVDGLPRSPAADVAA